jgi:hypothetical protein
MYLYIFRHFIQNINNVRMLEENDVRSTHRNQSGYSSPRQGCQIQGTKII